MRIGIILLTFFVSLTGCKHLPNCEVKQYDKIKNVYIIIDNYYYRPKRLKVCEIDGKYNIQLEDKLGKNYEFVTCKKPEIIRE